MTEPATEPVTCALCGTTAEVLPLGWSVSVEHGQRIVHCTACSREHLWAMEGKLDSAWW